MVDIGQVGSQQSGVTQTQGRVEISLGSASTFAGPSGRQTAQAVERALETLNQELGRQLPSDQQFRTQLRIDQRSARVVAEVVDRSSGQVIDSFPSELILGFIARTREQLGPLVDFDA